jgi:putative transcriptional regulator
VDVICSVLDCGPAGLLICEPEKVQARRPRRVEVVGEQPVARLGRHRSTPSA